MRKVSLLTRAVEDFRLVCLIKDNYSGDEIELDSMAYHLQQCCEKILKHLLKESYVICRKSCGMRELHDYFKQYNLDYPVQLKPYWVYLDKFEDGARYGDTVVGTWSVIEELLQVVSNLLTQQVQQRSKNKIDGMNVFENVENDLNAFEKLQREWQLCTKVATGSNDKRIQYFINRTEEALCFNEISRSQFDGLRQKVKEFREEWF